MLWPMKKTESKHLTYDQLARLLLLYKTEASEWEEATERLAALCTVLAWRLELERKR